MHNEAFVAHTNQLKEHRFKVSRIKIQFPPKNHYGKSAGAAAAAPPSVAVTTTSSSSTTGAGGGNAATGATSCVASNMTRSR